jgi:peroxiredoxin
MSELQGLQLSLEAFRQRSVEVVAVSPDPVEKNRSVVERFGLEFPILSDGALELTRGLGLEHPGAGPDGATIPRPATFIVRDGAVRWADLTPNYRIRPRPETILAALSELGVP